MVSPGSFRDQPESVMQKKLCVVLGSEKSGETFRSICQPYDQEPPEVGILAVEGEERDSDSLIIVAYEGGGAFLIRSRKGSKIIVRGGRPHKPFVLD